jgi:hypothetical protein
MTVLCVVAGAALGGAIGFWLGLQEGGDINFAPAIYGPAYAVSGAILGAVAAEVFVK